jgi:hypothetical protein
MLSVAHEEEIHAASVHMKGAAALKKSKSGFYSLPIPAMLPVNATSRTPFPSFAIHGQ